MKKQNEQADEFILDTMEPISYFRATIPVGQSTALLILISKFLYKVRHFRSKSITQTGAHSIDLERMNNKVDIGGV